MTIATELQREKKEIAIGWNIWPTQKRLRTVDVHIRRLRKNINLSTSKDLIRTVRSSGYSLDLVK